VAEGWGAISSGGWFEFIVRISVFAAMGALVVVIEVVIGLVVGELGKVGWEFMEKCDRLGENAAN